MEALKISEVISHVDLAKARGEKVGFIPTMGALHSGHISLVNKALTECDWVVSSIFVNPTQFNDPKDLLHYPRTPESDCILLEQAGCHLLFNPSVSEIYPEGLVSPDFEFGNLEKVMEGAHRPGHFKGVATVVFRLFDIVKPDVAYFGEKDFQQLAIIRSMVRQASLPIRIIGCETIREPDGLAMSSRNVRLSVDERNAAPIIFQNLSKAKELIEAKGMEGAKTEMIKTIEASGLFRVEYLEFADANSLQPVASISEENRPRVFIAVKASTTRLIDNMELL
ncbi:MAG: pantoate--beta-alanine ligase [Bacteroidota bacterium]